MATNQHPLKTAAAKHGTPVLLGALYILEAKGNLTNEERMVKAATSDVITERHDLDALMDEIYMDDLDFAGTYTDALEIALVRAGVA